MTFGVFSSVSTTKIMLEFMQIAPMKRIADHQS
uniref:Uncharacterized protein n=1 Tax=Candidatus Kentrum sp. FW TaxID=2126338 RepID=A0A450SS20_9GAMM|nr:MAG: hypothetical protein BECKFW1821A_GA0114235_103319 [Candidatus Kentron sp. FW]VFJ56721.1 MAG: hypothetical protein BECKFW1821B_GA0114236_102921 [Candidatus Kentron sp. FW]